MTTPEASRRNGPSEATRYRVSPVDAGRQEAEDTRPVLLVDIENRLVGVGDRVIQFRDIVPWRIIQLYAENVGGQFTSRDIARKLKLKWNNPDPVRLAIKKLNGPKYFGASYITSENDKGKNTYVYRMAARIVLEDLSVRFSEMTGNKPDVGRPPAPEPEVKTNKAQFVVGEDNIVRYRMTTGKLLSSTDPRRATEVQKTQLTILASDRRIRKRELMVDTRSHLGETDKQWNAGLVALNGILNVFMYEIFEERDDMLHDDFVGMRPIGRKTREIVDGTKPTKPGGRRSKGGSYS